MNTILADRPNRQRILVVDDDAVVRAVIRSLLVKLDREVNDASDGDEAIAKLRATPHDLIILDLTLPPCGGLHLYSKLQQDPYYRYIPVVVLTARDDDATRAQCHDAGARVFATKPFTPAQLLRSLRPLLRLDAAEALLMSSIIGSDRGLRVQDVPRSAREPA